MKCFWECDRDVFISHIRQRAGGGNISQQKIVRKCVDSPARFCQPPFVAEKLMNQKTTIQWTASEAESDIIERISKRAGRDLKQAPVNVFMDIEAVHCNGCPLDLEKLALFPALDFAHDVLGIARNINQTTGKLKNHFLPRSAAKQ